MALDKARVGVRTRARRSRLHLSRRITSHGRGRPRLHLLRRITVARARTPAPTSFATDYVARARTPAPTSSSRGLRRTGADARAYIFFSRITSHGRGRPRL